MRLGTTAAGDSDVRTSADPPLPVSGWRDGLKRVAAPASLGLVAGFCLAVATGATHAGGDVRTAFLLTGAAILVTGISVFSSWAVGQFAPDSEALAAWLDATLHGERMRETLVPLIHHLATTERHLAARAAG